MRTKISFLMIMLLLAIGCSKSHNGIIVGVKYDSVAQIPVTTAFSANDIDNVKYYPSDKAVAKALNSGKIDVAVLPITPLYLHDYKNIKILNNFVKGGYGILGNVKIDSLSALKGKTVGVLKKTLGEFLLEEIKDSLKIKVKTYSSAKIMDLDFTYEKIDGMALSLPQLIRKNSLKYKIVLWFSDYYSFFPVAQIAVNRFSYKNHKKEIETIIEKLNKIGNQLMDSPQLFFQTNEEIFNLTRYKAKEMAYRIRFLKTDFNKDNGFEKKYFYFMKKKGYTKLNSFKEILR